MWMTHQSAIRQAQNSLNVTGITSIAVWPAPANPLLWQAAAASSDAVYVRNINLYDPQGQWQELPGLDPTISSALRTSNDARKFLDFMRYGTATVEKRPDGTTVVAVRDLRFNLRMNAELDQELTVTSVAVRWF